MCLQEIGKYGTKYIWLSQDVVCSVLEHLVPQKGRNVFAEWPPDSEDTALSSHCCFNVSVGTEKMNPSQIIQLHGSGTTLCNVYNNDSISFNVIQMKHQLDATL